METPPPKVGSGFELLGSIVVGPAHRDESEFLQLLRCRSDGSLLLIDDQDVHEDHHTRLDQAPGYKLPELHWAPYQEFGVPDPGEETQEAPAGFLRIGSIGYRGNVIIVYWQPGLAAVET